MTAYAQPNNNAAIFWLLLLAAAFIVAAYTVPDDLHIEKAGAASDYCKCPSCDILTPCADILDGKCSVCRWLEHRREGRHARH